MYAFTEFGTSMPVALWAIKAEKDNEIKEQQKQFEKKEKERAKQEQTKIAALERKVPRICFSLFQ